MNEPTKQQPSANQAASDSVRVIDSETLFQGQKLVVIQHEGEDYRLILTRNNRLILQK